MKTILCYGDSNTYGYDPRGFFGGRYDKQNRWTDLLEASGKYRIINCGENGRCVPTDQWSIQILEDRIRKEKPDLLLIMLGTNDLLTGKTPKKITETMESFLKQLMQKFQDLPVLLLSPPHMSVPEFQTAETELADGFTQLIHRLPIHFADTFRWEIPLACDGVHFSEAGHRKFAEVLERELQKY